MRANSVAECRRKLRAVRLGARDSQWRVREAWSSLRARWRPTPNPLTARAFWSMSLRPGRGGSACHSHQIVGDRHALNRPVSPVHSERFGVEYRSVDWIDQVGEVLARAEHLCANVAVRLLERQ